MRSRTCGSRRCWAESPRWVTSVRRDGGGPARAGGSVVRGHRGVGAAMLNAKKLAQYRFEVGRALRTAHHLTTGDVEGDTSLAVRDLAKAVVALAQAIDDLLEVEERQLEGV